MRDVTVQTVTLGKRIAAIRKSRNLIQAGLAKKLGVARATVVQYEQGQITPPISMVHKLAQVLDETPEYIAFGVRVQKEVVVKIEVVMPE
jgi:transcriptional regulator with XRE-family HTH domain